MFRFFFVSIYLLTLVACTNIPPITEEPIPIKEHLKYQYLSADLMRKPVKEEFYNNLKKSLTNFLLQCMYCNEEEIMSNLINREQRKLDDIPYSNEFTELTQISINHGISSQFFVKEKSRYAYLNTKYTYNELAKLIEKKIYRSIKNENRTIKCIFNCKTLPRLYYVGETITANISEEGEVNIDKELPKPLWVYLDINGLIDSPTDPFRDNILNFSPSQQSQFLQGVHVYLLNDVTVENFIQYDRYLNVESPDFKISSNLENTRRQPKIKFKTFNVKFYQPFARRFYRNITSYDQNIFLYFGFSRAFKDIIYSDGKAILIDRDINILGIADPTIDSTN